MLGAGGILDPNFKPLTGTEEATIDDKNRLLVAKKKRERLGYNFALALGEAGCLIALPQPVWRRMCEEIASVPTLDIAKTQYARLLMAVADDELNFDTQGRVVIPAKMRRLANLGEKVQKVQVVGAFDRVEIWNFDEYEKWSKDPHAYGLARQDAFKKAYDEMMGRNP
jgi:division/cell wall cluster transcriptional repressor MraZ